jgi:hypothetical protein
MEKAWLTVDESVEGIKKVIDVTMKLTHGGRMWDYSGEQKAW